MWRQRARQKGRDRREETDGKDRVGDRGDTKRRSRKTDGGRQMGEKSRRDRRKTDK
jgi:hypothetical protein